MFEPCAHEAIFDSSPPVGEDRGEGDFLGNLTGLSRERVSHKKFVRSFAPIEGTLLFLV